MDNDTLKNNFIKGRGAQIDPKNRFVSQTYSQEDTESIDDWEQTKRNTSYIIEQSKTIVNEVTSPDVGMLFSLNPYQGCEHGCIYCYARNSHEYWGYSAGLDFESKIVVKQNAPLLLSQLFQSKKWTPATISLSGNTDCYQPIERKMNITRQLLEVCLLHRNPVSILTKNALVLRDLDIIQELSKYNLVSVFTSITSLRENIRMMLEPRTSTYKTRLKIVETMAKHNIPTGIMNAPIIPGLNDIDCHEVLKAASDAGAQCAGYTIVRLNGAISEIFKDWLYKTYPNGADKIWHTIESCHGGNVNDNRFKVRMKGEGIFAEIFKQQFTLFCKKFKLNEKPKSLNTTDFRRLHNGQQELF